MTNPEYESFLRRQQIAQILEKGVQAGLFEGFIRGGQVRYRMTRKGRAALEVADYGPHADQHSPLDLLDCPADSPKVVLAVPEGNST